MTIEKLIVESSTLTTSKCHPGTSMGASLQRQVLSFEFEYSARISEINARLRL